MYKFIITESDREHIRSLYSINEQEQPIMDVYYALTGDLQDYYGEDNVDLKGTPAKIHIFGKHRVTWNGTDLFIDNKRIKVNDFKTKTFGMGVDSNDVIYPNPEYITNRISKKQSVINDKFKDGRYLTTSPQGKEDIKKHEALKLNAYDLKDGHITIGYGHTGGMTPPTPKLGDKISKATAEKYFDNDIIVAEKIITDIMKSWKEQGHEYRITQNMFDAMVSIAFNTGRPTFRMCKFLQYLKQGKYEDAADEISFCATKKSKEDEDDNKEKLQKGIQNRRDKEQEKFRKDL